MSEHEEDVWEADSTDIQSFHVTHEGEPVEVSVVAAGHDDEARERVFERAVDSVAEEFADDREDGE